VWLTGCWANSYCWSSSIVMSSALTLACLGVAVFRIRHGTSRIKILIFWLFGKVHRCVRFLLLFIMLRQLNILIRLINFQFFGVITGLYDFWAIILLNIFSCNLILVCKFVWDIFTFFIKVVYFRFTWVF
jgi:hypothetical protein